MDNLVAIINAITEYSVENPVITWVIVLVAFFLLVLGGISLTKEGEKWSLRVGGVFQQVRLRRSRPVKREADEDVIGRFVGSLTSPFIVTLVLSRTVGDQVKEPVIEGASIRAARFYGYADAGRSSLKGKSLQELLDRLELFMDPKDFLEFKRDQKEVAIRFQNGGWPVADVPLRFNGDHPENEFQNAVFFPVLSHALDYETDKELKQYLTVIYIDSRQIPAAIFETPCEVAQAKAA